MRSLAQLDALPVSEWTEEEGLMHLSATFDDVSRQFPHLMEPYAILLGDADGKASAAIMRRGLRETIRRRYPDAARTEAAAE